jgi:Spy/CpxP family protein refolding chaperone
LPWLPRGQTVAGRPVPSAVSSGIVAIQSQSCERSVAMSCLSRYSTAVGLGAAGLVLTLMSQCLTAAEGAKMVAPGGYAGQTYVSPYGGSLQWLSMENVRKELELVEEQRQKIDQIRKDLQTDMTAEYKKIQDVPQDQRMQKYNEMNTALTEKVEKQIAAVLLPHQVKRLKEIKIQMQVRNYYGAGQALASDEVAKELKITEEQKVKLREVQQQIMQEYQQKMSEFYNKMRDEAMQKLTAVLTPQQRQELERLMGPKFEYSPYGVYGGRTQPGQGGGEKKR